jgi:hypothetical protein
MVSNVIMIKILNIRWQKDEIYQHNIFLNNNYAKVN